MKRIALTIVTAWIAVIGSAACGSSGSTDPGGASGDGGSAAAELIGTWQGTDTVTFMCDGGLQSDTVAHTIVIAAGTGSALAVSSSTTPCPFDFDLSGNVATARAGQSCTVDAGETVKLDSWTLTLSDDKSTLTSKESAADDGTGCTAASTGTYTKQSK